MLTLFFGGFGSAYLACRLLDRPGVREFVRTFGGGEAACPVWSFDPKRNGQSGSFRKDLDSRAIPSKPGDRDRG